MPDGPESSVFPHEYRRRSADHLLYRYFDYHRVRQTEYRFVVWLKRGDNLTILIVFPFKNDNLVDMCRLGLLPHFLSPRSKAFYIAVSSSSSQTECHVARPLLCLPDGVEMMA